LKGNAVALAGIAATAILGIAGTTTSWLVARDDRSNQRSLAHDNRVYDRRAGVYLDVLTMVERERRTFNTEFYRATSVDDWLSDVKALRTNPKVLDFHRFRQFREQLLQQGVIRARGDQLIVVPHEPDFPMANSNDAFLYARLVAFGSPRVVATYSRMRGMADHAQTYCCALASFGVKQIERVLSMKFRDDFQAEQRRLENLIHVELS
jgi:hypothetical protein